MFRLKLEKLKMVIKKFVDWFFSPTQKPVVEDYIDLYTRLMELENRVELLERENVETTNELYRMENSLDARIDIIAEHCKINTNV